MFTTQSMLALDYFNVLFHDEDGNWELQSKNTEHCWKLVYDNRGYSMYYKHHVEDNYHYQTGVGNIVYVVLYIVSHDEYQIRGRRTITRDEELRQGSYFFKLLDLYGLQGEKA